MITEVITWTQDSGYMLLLHKHESASLLKTTRSSSLYTADFDKDGLMEIPGEYEMPASVFTNVAEGLIPVAVGRNLFHCLNDGALTMFKAEFRIILKRILKYWSGFPNTPITTQLTGVN